VSNHLAVATVTATLQAVVQAAATASGVGSPRVTHLRPDAPGGLPAPGVNVYLYRVSPNPHWRNADLPTRRGAATLRRPQVGLDLHYLLSFFGDDAELEPQRLIGAVTRALHADPPLPRDVMRALADPASPSHAHYLAGSDLADQPELVRVTPTELNLEELSKLWSVFFQTRYVLSTAYTATVVLIEAETPPVSPAPPVATPRVVVRTQGDPWIDEVTPEAVAPTAAVPNPVIRLAGRNLLLQVNGVPSVVRFAAGTGTIQGSPSNERLDVALPAGVRIGENWVRVTNDGGLGAGHQLAASNTAAFALRPFLVSVTVLPPVGPEFVKRLQAAVQPEVGVQQSVRLVLLPEFAGGVRQAVAAPAPAAPTTSLEFDVNAVPAGDYRVMVEIDGQFSDRFGPVTL
jgi:hypothetical protein